MRRVLGACLVVTLLGLAVLPMAGPTAAQQAVRGGTLTFATGADPDNLDPQNTQSNPGEQVNRMMHENLVRFSAKMQLEPALAESWVASKDGLAWTFKLRKGVKFHDGTSFDAKAVKYFFDRVLGDEKPFKASLYTPVVQGAEVIDDSTVRVILKQPFGAFLFIMAHSAGAIVSPAAHQKWGKDLALHPVGTGPFKFVEWVKGDHVTMERHDGYWGGAPNLDRVVVKTVREDQARVLMLESGDADLIVNIPTEEIPRLRKDARFTIESSPTARALFIAINVKKKPFDDVRVRQALNYAVNRDAIVKELFQNNAQVIASHVSPLQNGYAQLSGYAYDPKKAKELLAQAGHPTLKVKWPRRSNKIWRRSVSKRRSPPWSGARTWPRRRRRRSRRPASSSCSAGPHPPARRDGGRSRYFTHPSLRRKATIVDFSSPGGWTTRSTKRPWPRPTRHVSARCARPSRSRSRRRPTSF